MPCGLALPALASLLLAATVEPALSLRVEGRGSRYAPDGQPATSRAAVLTTPEASLLVEGAPLRASAAYAGTFWTSDVGARPSPLVNHSVDARLELRPQAPWRAAATATLLRGETDPLAAAPTATAQAASQLASTGPVPYQALRADLRAERQLDLRSTLTAGAHWSDAQVLRGELRSIMPPQQGAGGAAGVSHRVTERDTLVASAAGDWSETRTAAGITTGASAALDATWRRALSPRLDGWARAGAAFAYTDEPALAVRRDVLPVAGAGLARGAGDRLAGELSANLSTFLDRFRGEVRPAADARLAVSFAAAPRWTVSGVGSGGRRLDGETSVAAADLRLAWAARPGALALELGALWRLQRERRPELPSFSEAGVFMGLQYTAGRR